MSNDIQTGTFRVRGIAGSVTFGTASTGTEQVGVGIEFLEGPNHGRRLVWFGSFTENAEDRTLESLRYLGWDNDDIADMSGIGSIEAEAVIEEEEGQDGKPRIRVQWINRARGPSFKNPMNDTQLRSFAARMKGKAVASRQKFDPKQAAASAANGQRRAPGSSRQDGPPPHTDDDLGF